MKKRLALTAYYSSVGILVILTAVIVVKLLFWPACTPTGTGSSCTVDGWSVAGLAATILGVSAAVLAILGTVAVAGWWTILDQRIKDQVTSLFDEQKEQLNQRVDKLLAEQEGKAAEQLNQRVDKLLAEQERKADEQLRTFQTQFEEHRKSMGELNKGVEGLRTFVDNIVELALDVAMVNPPWEIEEWSSTTMEKFKIPDLAKRMVFSYLSYLDHLLPPNTSSLARFTARLAQQNAPTSPLYYWDRALRWQKILDDYNPDVLDKYVFFAEPAHRVAEIQKEVKEKMEIYRSKVESWRKQQI